MGMKLLESRKAKFALLFHGWRSGQSLAARRFSEAPASASRSTSASLTATPALLLLPKHTLCYIEVKTLTTYSMLSHVLLISFLQNLVSKNNYSLLLMRGSVQKRLKKGFIRKPIYELKPSLHCYSAFLLSILNPHGWVRNHSGFFSLFHFTMLESNKINLWIIWTHREKR